MLPIELGISSDSILMTLGAVGGALFYAAIAYSFWSTRKRRGIEGQQISSSGFSWREGIDGIEVMRHDTVLWGPKQWLFAPNRAVVGRRTVPVTGYAITRPGRRKDPYHYTIWGLQAGGSRVVLLRSMVSVVGPWRPLEVALEGITHTRHDPGTEDDVPAALRAIQESRT